MNPLVKTRNALLAAAALSALAACSQGSTPPPGGTVSLQGLSDGATVQGSLSVTATAPGATSRVAFKLDGQPDSADLTAPYAFSKGGLVAGSHTLVVAALDKDENTIGSRTLTFNSVGAAAKLGALSVVANGASLSVSVPLTSGRAPDQVIVTISQGSASNQTLHVFDAKTLAGQPYSVNFDTSALQPGDFDVTAQAINSDHAVESSVSAQFTKSGAATESRPGIFEEFGSSPFNPAPTEGDPAMRGWVSDTAGSSDSYTWVNGTQAANPADKWNATVIRAHNVRDVNGPDSRYYKALPRTVTDADSFQFWVIFRVIGRSSEIDEWKVGRFGLIKMNNTTASENGQVQAKNNNINSIGFEVEAQFNYPTGIFALVNLNRQDCQQTQRLDCSRRQSNKIPLDPAANPSAPGNTSAGFNTWMYVKCAYSASDRTFQCIGRDDEHNVSIGSTQPVTLASDEHFSVDAFSINSSGRPVFNGETPTLDWEVGRADFRILN